MLVISRILTIGQSSFLLRVVITGLLYGGLFLLTSIVLGYAPRISTIKTHDVLNRIVGSSTVKMSSIKWIYHRILRRHKDTGTSFSLILAVTLLLGYGFFGTIADIGLIGLATCTVPGGSYQDYPASVKSVDDAQAIITTNVLNGSDPGAINSYRCDAAQDTTTGVANNITDSICTVWHNSTYGDPTGFRGLNTTDSDVLMPKNIGVFPFDSGMIQPPNAYILAPSTGQLVPEPVFIPGIAIRPHAIGVQMFVGVPQLSANRRVTIPKILALETEMGCVNLGVVSEMDIETPSSLASYFTPDNLYNSSARQYSGPDYLEQPLITTAHAFRSLVRPSFNMTDTDSDGLARAVNQSTPLDPGLTLTWTTEVQPNPVDSTYYNTLLDNCTQEIYHNLNVTPPQQPQPSCSYYYVTGSFSTSQTATLSSSVVICAVATQINMVSALLEVDADGNFTANVTRLPSDLNVVNAGFFNAEAAQYGWTQESTERFTLSDNPNGKLQHFIYQEPISTNRFGYDITLGSGSMGHVLATVGTTVTGNGLVQMDELPLLSIIDSNTFSSNGFHPKQLTKWGGALGASYLLGTVRYNAWAALDAEPVTVVSTGGVPATCYKIRYGIALLPLLLTAPLIAIWSIVLLFSTRFRVAGKLKGVYGGLAPMMVAPESGKPPSNAIVGWEGEPKLHLKLVSEGTPIKGDKAETLVEYLRRVGTCAEKAEEIELLTVMEVSRE